MRSARTVLAAVALLAMAAACSGDDDGEDTASTDAEAESAQDVDRVDNFVYQLQNYADEGLDELAEAPHDLAVIDLTRDGHDDYFTAEEIGDLQDSGKTVLAYFEIGSIEDFRPEYDALPDDMILNQWPEWPEEYFVRYWEPAWWDTVIRPRVDQALDAGFDGVYLDTPLAYENIDLSLVEGEDRETLGQKMVELIERISRYGKEHDPEFLVFPQNSPELRQHPGYVDAIDGLGVEGMFFTADEDSSDQPCEQEWCPEDLDNVRALRDEGKLILAVDYATESDNVEEACTRYEEEGFAGYVTVRPLDTIAPPCP
jgi:cysteinyl-tRNA synthetase, unknown class